MPWASVWTRVRASSGRLATGVMGSAPIGPTTSSCYYAMASTMVGRIASAARPRPIRTLVRAKRSLAVPGSRCRWCRCRRTARRSASASRRGAHLPPSVANGVFIAEHGPFDKSYRNGHRLVFLSLVPGRQGAGPHGFATGWVGAEDTLWSNPVAIVVGPDGALYVSGNLAGTVYRLA